MYPQQTQILFVHMEVPKITALPPPRFLNAF